MAEMPATTPAMDFSTLHEQGAVGGGADGICQRLPEARPAGALSNLVDDENRSSAQPAQVKTPARFSWSSGLVKGGSVPSRRSTSNCSGVRSLRHSASVCVTSNAGAGAFAARPLESTAAVKMPAPADRIVRLFIMIAGVYGFDSAWPQGVDHRLVNWLH